MYVIRDIFQLKFGHFKEARNLLNDAVARKLMPEAAGLRALSDFTGPAYRLIMEISFNSLAEYEKSLTSELSKDDWQQWYQQFKQHVDSSYREILKQVI